jgi:predicted PurR-regulated permease PerM
MTIQLDRMQTSAANGEQQNYFTRERLLTLVLGGATLIALYVCYQLVKPFIPPMAFALALAVATQLPYNWIRSRMPNDAAAAAVAIVLVTILIIGPAIGLGTYIVQQAAQHLGELQSGETILNWRSALDRQPVLGPIVEWAETRLNIQEQLQKLGSALAGQAAGFLRGSMDVLTQLVIMLFVLFFLYRDRKQAYRALCQTVPLSTDEADRLFSRVASTILATVNGSFTVALVQATMAGIMYWILQVPAPAIWASLTFITALIPVFGTFLVWGPITVYLLLSGSFVKALILVGWGMVAIGTIDNILYPYLVGDRLRLHTVPTFFAILGGVALFGPAGLILGPLTLAITLALIDVWWLRTTGGKAAEDAVADTSVTETVPPGAALRSHDK